MTAHPEAGDQLRDLAGPSGLEAFRERCRVSAVRRVKGHHDPVAGDPPTGSAPSRCVHALGQPCGREAVECAERIHVLDRTPGSDATQIERTPRKSQLLPHGQRSVIVEEVTHPRVIERKNSGTHPRARIEIANRARTPPDPCHLNRLFEGGHPCRRDVAA